jgi:hypothetical protein
LIGTIYGFTAFVDARIERITSGDAFMDKVASRVRPSVVFNQRGSILADMGAMDVIENITLTNYSTALPGTIIITPKRFLAHAPILSTIDPFTLNVLEERGNKFDWIYHIGYVSASWNKDPFSSIRFRLEIVR